MVALTLLSSFSYGTEPRAALPGMAAAGPEHLKYPGLN